MVERSKEVFSFPVLCVQPPLRGRTELIHTKELTAVPRENKVFSP